MSTVEWYKGSLHSHTTESDGDASPIDVAMWYKDHGYDWLVISDHNKLTSVDTTPLESNSGKFLTILGEEVTAELPGELLPVYVNAFCLSSVVLPVIGDGILPTLQANIDAVTEAGGIASFGAPYYRDGFDYTKLVGIKGPRLMEIYNAHPGNTKGDPRTFSYENVWDMLLSAGQVLYGTACDDAHNYFSFSADNSNPGRAWVMVRADELSEEAIFKSLISGDFYSSTGVFLNKLTVTPDIIQLNIQQNSIQTYTTTIIGNDAVVLDTQAGLDVTYKIKGDEGYVRARVESSWGARSWIQPIFIR